MKSFAENEVTFTVIDDANQSLLKADQDYARATGDWNGVSRRLRTIIESQEKFSQQGDRIVLLLTGQGCPLPDHVTSPTTFRADMQACNAAKGAPEETKACGFITRAVATTMA
ncbi:MAG TPA: hypothetical protein VF636_03975, partial [Sphingomonas sp.]